MTELLIGSLQGKSAKLDYVYTEVTVGALTFEFLLSSFSSCRTFSTSFLFTFCSHLGAGGALS